MFDFLSKYIVPTLLITVTLIFVTSNIFPNVETEDYIYSVLFISLIITIISVKILNKREIIINKLKKILKIIKRGLVCRKK